MASDRTRRQWRQPCKGHEGNTEVLHYRRSPYCTKPDMACSTLGHPAASGKGSSLDRGGLAAGIRNKAAAQC